MGFGRQSWWKILFNRLKTENRMSNKDWLLFSVYISSMYAKMYYLANILNVFCLLVWGYYKNVHTITCL